MNIVILAAGLGQRMRSAHPKVLHPLGGKPLLAHVLAAAQALTPTRIIVVYGHGGNAVRAAFASEAITWVEQSPQLGTGHAVLQALPYLDTTLPVLVLYGDVPLIQATTLHHLQNLAAHTAMALLTTVLDTPTGYGRIVRDQGVITHIVEEKDANADERAITEVNTGILIAPGPALARWLPSLSNGNAQNEYYLTDIVKLATADGVAVHALTTDQAWEVQGVNDRAQLAELERIWQRHIAHALMISGTTLLDPTRLEVRGDLVCERDVVIDVGCIFQGQVRLGAEVTIGANCFIRDSQIAAGTRIEPYSFIDGATIGEDCVIGPYARLRPGSALAADVHIGNFVEIKNSHIAQGSKANHLTYLGDADIGCDVNIGAGTITCNYDGANKHRTVIEDRAFIGSNTELIAPVRVGRGATIGAGTTLTKDAPPNALTLTRTAQKTFTDWRRPIKSAKIKDKE